MITPYFIVYKKEGRKARICYPHVFMYKKLYLVCQEIFLQRKENKKADSSALEGIRFVMEVTYDFRTQPQCARTAVSVLGDRRVSFSCLAQI